MRHSDELKAAMAKIMSRHKVWKKNPSDPRNMEEEVMSFIDEDESQSNNGPNFARSR